MENKLHYIKLKPKQFKWLKVMLVSFILMLICCVMLNRIIEMKKAIIIASIAVLSVIIIAFINVKTRKYSYLIENFIRSNNLLQVYNDEHCKEEIEYYLNVEYVVKNNLLYLRGQLDGSLIAQKLRGIEQALADCLCSLCADVIEERGYITYIFELSMPRQDTIHSLEELPILEEGKIFLSNLLIDWKECPHMLIAGLIGSGKTMLVQYLMYILSNQGVRVIYCDPKNDTEIRWFCKQHDIKYYSNINDIAKVVRETEEEMRLREYRALLRYVNRETWSCFPSIRTIANDTGLSKRTIIRKLGVLEKEKLIIKIHRTRDNNGKTSNMYFLSRIIICLICL